MTNNTDQLKVALAQISPVWLNKEQTKAKIKTYISDAGAQNCDLVVFGEGFLPGYSFWLSTRQRWFVYRSTRRTMDYRTRHR